MFGSFIGLDWFPGEDWIALGGVFVIAALALLGGYTIMTRRGGGPGEPPASSRRNSKIFKMPDPFLQGSTSERRTGMRRKGLEVEVLLRDEAAKTDLGRAMVLDRSTGGLCLRSVKAFEVGSVLSVWPASASISVPWLQIIVRSCREKEGQWEVGCQFTRQPTWNVLMLFG